MKFLKLLFTIPLIFIAFQNHFGQNIENVDGVKYFDENQRWYNNFTEHWFSFPDIPLNEVRNSIIYWEEIGKDLKTPTNEWEGTYENGGETHGDFFRWSAKSGFILLNVNKCQGGPMRITRGRVQITKTSVKFIPEIVLGTTSHQGHSQSENNKIREFLFVKWRKAYFLVQPDEITRFAQFTAGLDGLTNGYFDEGRYFSKVLQGYTGSANELPIFPVGYEKYVKKPFKATIVSIGKGFRRAKKPQFEEDRTRIEENYDDWVTEVKVNIGKSSQISPNVYLKFLPESQDDYATDGIIIKKVFANYSIGEYFVDIPKKDCKKSEFENCEASEGKSLKAGLKVSTTGEW